MPQNWFRNNSAELMQYWRLCKRISWPLRMCAEFFNGIFAVFTLIAPDIILACPKQTAYKIAYLIIRWIFLNVMLDGLFYHGLSDR